MSFFVLTLRFFLSLVFWNLIMKWLGLDFFRLNLFGVHSASWICIFVSFAKFGTFPTIFLYHFSLLPSFSSKTGDTSLRSVLFSTSPLGSCHFLSLSVWVNFISSASFPRFSVLCPHGHPGEGWADLPAVSVCCPFPGPLIGKHVFLVFLSFLVFLFPCLFVYSCWCFWGASLPSTQSGIDGSKKKF